MRMITSRDNLDISARQTKNKALKVPAREIRTNCIESAFLVWCGSFGSELENCNAWVGTSHFQFLFLYVLAEAPKLQPECIGSIARRKSVGEIKACRVGPKKG